MSKFEKLTIRLNNNDIEAIVDLEKILYIIPTDDEEYVKANFGNIDICIKTSFQILQEKLIFFDASN